MFILSGAASPTPILIFCICPFNYTVIYLLCIHDFDQVKYMKKHDVRQRLDSYCIVLRNCRVLLSIKSEEKTVAYILINIPRTFEYLSDHVLEHDGAVVDVLAFVHGFIQRHSV